MATAVAVAVTVMALIGNRHFLSAIFGNLDQQVLDDAVTYFFLVALSYPCLAVYNSCAALYRSMGNSKISMQVSMLMNGINVVGNAICIYGLHMGVEGVAIPTLISRGVAAVVMMKLIQNPDNVIRITSFSDLIQNRMLIGKILQIGVPNGVENSMFQIGKIGLAYVFVKVLGHGVLSIWVAMYIDWVVRVVLYLWRFRGFEERRIGLV